MHFIQLQLQNLYKRITYQIVAWCLKEVCNASVKVAKINSIVASFKYCSLRSKTREPQKAAIKTRETFSRRHARRVVCEETCKRQTSSRRVSRANVSSLGFSSLFPPSFSRISLFFHLLSLLHISNFFFLFSFFPLFSFPDGLCNPRTSEGDICVVECR